MDEPLFKVANHHSERSGEPPVLDGDSRGSYCGYFSNEHGEQAIYEYDYETGEATVRMGDASWGDSFRVVNGRVDGLVLTQPEAMWILACWIATGGSKERLRSDSDGESTSE